MNVPVKVQSLGLDRSSNTPVVILREEGGDRVLPIWIGPGEASAIAMHLADMKFSRPLTHDLIVSVLHGLGGALQRVLISRVTDATFFAELVVRVGDRDVVLDARPSDSIAVALRTRAPIFANEALLERASIDLSEEEAFSEQEEEGGEGPGVEDPFPWDWPDPADAAPGGAQGQGAGPSGGGQGAGGGSKAGPGSRGPARPMGAEELKEYLRKLNPEDFGRFTP